MTAAVGATATALVVAAGFGTSGPPAAAVRMIGRLADPVPATGSASGSGSGASGTTGTGTRGSTDTTGVTGNTGTTGMPVGQHRAGQLAAESAGLRTESITVDRVRRSYLISIPTGLRAPAPLVLAFHGLHGNAAAFARQSGLVPATAAAREILVLPQSTGPGFNDGRFGPTGPRDDDFAVAIIDSLVRRGIADPERVTVAGFSNGAGMAMEIADAHPDRIAAVVSIDGEMIAGSLAPRPTGPVEAVLVHGTADPIQPWAGRTRWGPDAPPYISAMRTVDAWVRADACGALSTSTLPGRIGRGAAGPVTVERWAPGPSGAGVTFYRVAGLHHRWPVAAPSAGRSDQLAAIDATEIVVRTALEATREGRRTIVV